MTSSTPREVVLDILHRLLEALGEIVESDTDRTSNIDNITITDNKRVITESVSTGFKDVISNHDSDSLISCDSSVGDMSINSLVEPRC